MHRRQVLAGIASLAAAGVHGSARADGPGLRPTIAARSPWMCNAVALTRDNRMFLGLPRHAGPEHFDTPSLARLMPDGAVTAFPGGPWNAWTPGADPRNAFVYVNTVHIFADDTLWCVDMGATYFESATPGAAKYVQIDPRTGRILQVIRLAPEIAPPGTKLNDIRIHGTWLYGTDSGLGAIIVHDLGTGRTLRRLSGRSQVLTAANRLPPPSKTIKHKTPASDLIELTADGETLLWASPLGPFYSAPTRLLQDPSASDDDIVAHTQFGADFKLVTGTAMDTRGNIYLGEPHAQAIILLTPDGQRLPLATGPDFASPDAMFISRDRHLYCPQTQGPLTTLITGKPDATHRPYLVFSMALPDSFEDAPIGDAVTGS